MKPTVPRGVFVLDLSRRALLGFDVIAVLRHCLHITTDRLNCGQLGRASDGSDFSQILLEGDN